MGTIDISYYNLFIGLLLLAIPFFYLWKFKTELLKPALIGTLRMIIQLFFIGMYLKYLFLWNNPWINFLWVIIMVFVAGQTALVRTQLKRSVLLIPITVGFLCSVVLVGLYFIGIVLQLDNIFSAQYFIPVFGSEKLADVLTRETAIAASNRALGIFDAGEESLLNLLSVRGAELSIGYLTNEKEEELLMQQAYQEKLAEGISKAILEACEELKTAEEQN